MTLRRLCSIQTGMLFCLLFGGLAKGNAKPLSDVDIAVYLRDIGDPAGYKLDLFSRLSDALATSEIDLVILNTAPISLAGRILQNKQVLVDKEPPRRHSYESLNLREFFDFRYKERPSSKGGTGLVAENSRFPDAILSYLKKEGK